MAAVAVAVFVGSLSAQMDLTLVDCGGENERTCLATDLEFIQTGLACDRGLKAVGTTCVNEFRRQVAVDAWTNWAIRNQLDLAIDEPINWTSRLGTHNSFNNWNDDYPFPNHGWSMTDQLRLGARHLDLDLHWFNSHVRLCHGTEAHTGCSPFDRPYVYGIKEIGAWVNSSSASGQILTISYEDHSEARHSYVEDPLTAYFGSRLARPADFPNLGRLPTTRELLAKGRRALVWNPWDTHGGDLFFGELALSGSTGLLFYEDANGNDQPNVQFEAANRICKTGLSNGTGFNLLTLNNLFSMIAENRLFVSTAWDITGADVSRAARCLVSVLALDEFGGFPALLHNNPTDTRHASAIWSWQSGDSGHNGDAVVMLQNSSNRWASRNPLEVHQFLCGRQRSESPGDPKDWLGTGKPGKQRHDWKVTSAAGTWVQGGQKCLEEFGEDYVFSVPVNGYENVQAALSSDVISTWMNYNDIKDEDSWVINKRPIANASKTAAFVECTGTTGAVATLDGTLSIDPEKDPLTYAWTGPFGVAAGATAQVTLPVGTHNVRLVTDDGFSGVDPDNVQVTVRDTTKPVIESLTPAPPKSWPPNHKMVPVTVTVKAKDACDANLRNRIVSVTSNEPVGARGAGKPTSPDWQITGPLTVNLSSERTGNGSGRVYTLTIESADASGNKTLGTTTVLIPHNNGVGNRTITPPARGRK